MENRFTQLFLFLCNSRLIHQRRLSYAKLHKNWTENLHDYESKFEIFCVEIIIRMYDGCPVKHGGGSVMELVKIDERFCLSNQMLFYHALSSGKNLTGYTPNHGLAWTSTLLKLCGIILTEEKKQRQQTSKERFQRPSGSLENYF